MERPGLQYRGRNAVLKHFARTGEIVLLDGFALRRSERQRDAAIISYVTRNVDQISETEEANVIFSCGCFPHSRIDDMLQRRGCRYVFDLFG